MDTTPLLNVDQIIPSMRATEHWDAIGELIDHLVAHGYLLEEDRSGVETSLHAREEKMSTGIGFGVAIPHALSDRVERVLAAFGRSEEGIDFEAVDNVPVRLIFLFLVPEEKYNLHLRTLANIGKLFHNGALRRQLEDAASAEEIHTILQKGGRAPSSRASKG